MIASLHMSENYGLWKRFDTDEVLGIVFFSSAMSFMMEVNKDMNTAWMLELIPICICQLPSLNPFKEGDPSFSSNMGRDKLSKTQFIKIGHKPTAVPLND